MIVVIQCAARKQADAGHLRTEDGKRVVFVADPTLVRPEDGLAYARPDDLSHSGKSWREVLREYKDQRKGNPLNLYRAYQLYQHRIYSRLVDRFGIEKTYILSAGWGLIRADFLTPYYDITFSPSAEPYKRRRKTDAYQDFCMLPQDSEEEIVFFGGKDYLSLFQALTETAIGKRTVFYNSNRAPELAGCSLKRFKTSTRTNWHYECVSEFLRSV